MVKPQFKFFVCECEGGGGPPGNFMIWVAFSLNGGAPPMVFARSATERVRGGGGGGGGGVRKTFEEIETMMVEHGEISLPNTGNNQSTHPCLLWYLSLDVEFIF